MPGVRLVISDPVLKQMVLSLVNNESLHTTGSFDTLIVELTGKVDCKGASAVREHRALTPDLPAIAVSRADGPAITKQAVRSGVNDYFRLPAESEEFREATKALLSGNEAPVKNRNQRNVLLGESSQIVGLRKYVARVAMTDSSVLITGETGTGKELVAELIHKSGARRNKPFVCVNSAALPDTLLESELFGFEKGAFTGAYTRYQGKLRMAHGGTIFFDEIGDLSRGAQAKLLRALETREVHPLGGWRDESVDVRVIAATNRDLETMTSAGDFRHDLFHRINVVRIELPPLRQRKEDISPLVRHYMDFFNRQFNRNVEGIEAEAMSVVQSYDWPGNIRELRNVVESSFVNATSNLIRLQDLPERLRRPPKTDTACDSREKLVSTLLATNWNISRVADRLQCSRMTIYRRMAQHQISRIAH